jgi:hypothetical protein
MRSAEELGQRRGKVLRSVISGQPAPGSSNGNGAAAAEPAAEGATNGR